jgi:tetratricopeptide (TPR) repeat protein
MRRVIVFGLALALMAAWGVAYRRLSLMDGLPYQLSATGLHGLGLYLGGDWAGAARAWRAGRRGPVPAYGDDTTGTYAVAAGDLAVGERRARTTLLVVPTALEPRLTLAEIALSRGRFSDALQHLSEVRARRADDVDALVLTSLARARLDQDRAAIEAMNRALRQGSAGSRPTIVLAALELAGELATPPGRRFALRAHLHRYLRIFDEAHGDMTIAYARQAVAAGDHPAEAYLAWGIVLDKRRHHLDALRMFQQAVAADPGHAEAYRWAAVQAWRLHDPLLQYRMVRAAFEAAPADPYYLESVDQVVTRWFGDTRATAALMQRAVEADPANRPAHERLARAAEALGETQRAAEHKRRAAELGGPRDPR